MKRIVLAALAAALPAAASAQAALSPADIVDFALDVCISDTADVGVNVETGDFMIRGRSGDTATYVHPEGPELALTVRPAFFGCELTVEDTSPEEFEALMAELSPAMEERFGRAPETAGDGAVWEIAAQDDPTITTEVSRADDGTLTLTSATDAAPQPPSQ